MKDKLKMIQLAALLVAFAARSDRVYFIIRNNELGDISVGIQGNPGHAHLNNGGFTLAPGQELSVSALDHWAGRFWARTWCDGSHCETGDCENRYECAGAGPASPATVIEVTLRCLGDEDYYYVSLEHGFNIPAQIEPLVVVGDGSQHSCTRAACTYRITEDCPGELQVSNLEYVIGCKSACSVFDTDKYCCRGDYNRPHTCRPSDWPENYPKFFKDRCPDAYSFVYDDIRSTFKCKASAYRITFGG